LGAGAEGPVSELADQDSEAIVFHAFAPRLSGCEEFATFEPKKEDPAAGAFRSSRMRLLMYPLRLRLSAAALSWAALRIDPSMEIPRVMRRFLVLNASVISCEFFATF
jgi:hypothetical protein